MYSHVFYQRAGLWLLVLSNLISLTVYGQQRIAGRVQTTTGEPLPGATITLLNTNRGTVTGTDGGFVLENLANGTYVLSINSVGYATRTRPFTLPGPGQLEPIILSESDNRWCCSGTLSVLDDLGSLALHHSNSGVSGTYVND